jgi:hypothetical protein
MPFSDLYDRVQEQTPKISSRWIRDEVIHLTHISAVKEQWTGLIDTESMRGFFIEGPLKPPVPLAENEALIVLARALPKEWRRFVYTKELMHAFDTPEEKADTPEKFDLQVERLGDPSAEISPQYRAEAKAFWRALATLCPEEHRLAFKAATEAGEISPAVIGARLQIPTQYVRNLLREDFTAIVEKLK